MLTIEQDDGLMVVKATDKITQADIERFEPQFDEMAEDRGRVPLVIDATALQGYTPEALWSDLKFDSAHRDQIGPMAIVSDGGWKAWATKLSQLFFKEPVRHFGADRLADAKDWVHSQLRR